MIIKGKGTIKDARTLGRVPIVGKLYYWWFGGGRKYINKQKEGIRL
jgi:hypothetical protein